MSDPQDMFEFIENAGMKKREFEAAMLRYLEGTATPDEAAALSEIMRRSEAFRKQAVRLSLQHLQLFEIAEAETVLQGELQPYSEGIQKHTQNDQRKQNSPFFRTWLFPLTSIAATIILLFLLFSNTSPFDPPAQTDPETIATGNGTGSPPPILTPTTGVEVEVVNAENLHLDSGLPDFQPGQKINLDTLKILSGTLQFQLASGVTVWVEGPADMDFHDPMHVSLLKGKITADVEPQGRGFTIDTVNAKIVDLGTQFGIDLDEAGNLDVVTFKGKVEVLESAGDIQKPALQLTEGQALRIDSQKTKQPISSVLTCSEQNLWSTSDQPFCQSVIASVSDNKENRWSFQFYPIRVKGMTEGVYAWPYETNKPRWWSPDGKGLPEWLEGADLVQTLQQELGNKELEITVTLTQPAMLYIFHQAKGLIPSWLSENFEQTGVPLRLSPDPINSMELIGRNPRYEVEFQVWRKRMDQAGIVHLGPTAKEDNNSPPFYMYGIAAKALSEIESQSN